MNRALSLLQTTIGKKVLMALTGVVWFGYCIAHMSGNLLIFAGPEAINDYATFLHGSPLLLWGARGVLLAALLGHLWASLQLTRTNLKARPVPYSRQEDVATSYAARTMVWSGPILFAFLVYHIAHLTLGAVPGHPFDEHDVYGNLIRGFRRPGVAAAYVVAIGALALHLHHGAWSFFQSLGLNHPRYNAARRHFATILTVLVVLGFVSVPLAVLTGLIPPAGAQATALAR